MSCKQTQYEVLGKLLRRKCGVTAMEIIQKVGTTCPHKRMSEMKAKGWKIVRKEIKGRSYGSYHGTKV